MAVLKVKTPLCVLSVHPNNLLYHTQKKVCLYLIDS